CLGLPVQQGPVIYITSDGDPDLLRNIQRQWIGRGGDLARLKALPLHVHASTDFCLERGHAHARLRMTLDAFGTTPALFILETISTNVETTNLNAQEEV